MLIIDSTAELVSTGRFAFDRVPAIMLKGKRDQVEAMGGTGKGVGELLPDRGERAGRRRSLRRRSATGLRRFWRVMTDANVTGSAAMVAYNMLLAVVPVALLALFVGGQILSSHSVQQSVLRDLRGIFPGADVHTLDSLLDQIRSSTASTGVLALLASVWLGSSFWGALDTAFARIYRCKSRPWLEQKRFALGMLIVVLLFMIATVAVPTVQSILKAGASPDDSANRPGGQIRAAEGVSFHPASTAASLSLIAPEHLPTTGRKRRAAVSGSIRRVEAVERRCPMRASRRPERLNALEFRESLAPRHRGGSSSTRSFGANARPVAMPAWWSKSRRPTRAAQ